MKKSDVSFSPASTSIIVTLWVPAGTEGTAKGVTAVFPVAFPLARKAWSNHTSNVPFEVLIVAFNRTEAPTRAKDGLK